MAQTILSEKKSTSGSPYAFYTVEVTPSGRTANSVKLAVTVKSHLQYSESYKGTGLTVTGYLTIGETDYSIPLKLSSTVWSGTTVYKASKNITVNGLSATATSITKVKFSVSTSGGSSALSSTSCSDITISSGNSASGFSLSHNPARLGDSVTVTINSVVSTNYHKIVATAGSNSYTFTTKAKTSADLAFTASRFGSWFSITSKELEVTLTMTTYNSSGTSLGSVEQEITILMTDALGKPSTPTAVISEKTANGATINLTRPSSYQYGATFSEWSITTNEGAVSVSGDTITATIEEVINKNHIATIRAIDSRGFASDPVYVAWYLRKKGICIYTGEGWNPANATAYTNGAWADNQAYVYAGGNWNGIR